MAGNHSRDKGARGEVELRALLAAHSPVKKLSGMYQEGPDVFWAGRYVEVKRWKAPISRKLDALLADAQIVVERADYGEWVAHLRLDELLDMLDEATDGGQQ